MKNTAGERLGTMLLAGILQVCGAGDEWGAAAQPATNEAGGDRVVVTVEVEEKVRASRWRDPSQFGEKLDVPAPLLHPSDFPTMTVDIDPADPRDFVVTINGKPYQAGARIFRVLAGTTTITVTRRGKEPCKATLEVTTGGPNAVACRL
jgi:hypothetical protein